MAAWLGLLLRDEGRWRGEQVVSAGQVKLRNGQAVNIDNSVTLDGKAGGG